MGTKRRFKLLACEILRQEISALAADAPHDIDIEFLPQELHMIGRVRMKNRLTEYLATVDQHSYDAILLGFALCSGGIAGLSAETIPLVVPRAHDCITLFLGSRQRYQDHFFANGGTYFLTTGWLEQNNAFDDEKRYGMDMLSFYSKLVFIEMGVEPPGNTFEQQARQIAEERHWEFEKLTGDLSLFRRLMSGDWDEDFLVVPPGKQIRASYDDDVIELAPD